MTGKAATTEKKVAARKTSAIKTLAKKRINKGDYLECEVCGLSVTVENVGGIAVGEENTLLCCNKPMKENTSKRKAAKK